jgi:hypothetical protein
MKTYEVTVLIRVFAVLNIEASSEIAARSSAAQRVSEGDISYQDHTAELDSIESVEEIQGS